MKWEIQWENVLMERLSNHGIECERTSFKITSDLKKYRDYDWESSITSGQVVELIYPKRKGSKIKIKSISENELPVEVGTISFYNEEIEFKKGIICQLIGFIHKFCESSEKGVDFGHERRK